MCDKSHDYDLPRPVYSTQTSNVLSGIYMTSFRTPVWGTQKECEAQSLKLHAAVKDVSQPSEHEDVNMATVLRAGISEGASLQKQTTLTGLRNVILCNNYCLKSGLHLRQRRSETRGD